MWFNIASLNGSAEAIAERNAVAEAMTASAVEEAQELALRCIQSKYADCGLSITPKQTAEKQPPVLEAILDGVALGNAFKSQSVLRRKQLQYALKKLGVYSSSVDGLWGNGTKTAFSNFIKINDLKVGSIEDVFASVLSKVDVPTAFATPKRNTSTSRSTPNNMALKAPKGWSTFSGSAEIGFEQAMAICKPQSENAWDREPGVEFDTSYNCNGYGNNYNCRSYSGPANAAQGLAAGLVSGLMKREAKQRVLKSCMARYGWKKN